MDYLTWTRDVALLVTDTISRLTLKQPLILWTTGLVSPVAQSKLGELQVLLALNPNGAIGIPSPEIVNYEIWDDSVPESQRGFSLHPRIMEVLPDW